MTANLRPRKVAEVAGDRGRTPPQGVSVEGQTAASAQQGFHKATTAHLNALLRTLAHLGPRPHLDEQEDDGDDPDGPEVGLRASLHCVLHLKGPLLEHRLAVQLEEPEVVVVRQLPQLVPLCLSNPHPRRGKGVAEVPV